MDRNGKIDQKKLVLFILFFFFFLMSVLGVNIWSLFSFQNIIYKQENRKCQKICPNFSQCFKDDLLCTLRMIQRCINYVSFGDAVLESAYILTIMVRASPNQKTFLFLYPRSKVSSKFLSSPHINGWGFHTQNIITFQFSI